MLIAICSFVAGMIVMDFLWAWKLGMPQAMWQRFKRKDKRDIYEMEDFD